MPFTCPRCSRTSHHPEDERHGYCGACHWWTGDPSLGSPEVLELVEAAGVIDPIEPTELPHV